MAVGKGHDGNPGNEEADELANLGIYDEAMRQIVLDTETTGLSTAQGHRIIEIGCIEMVNRRLTGREFHRFLNPDRDIDEGAEACMASAARNSKQSRAFTRSWMISRVRERRRTRYSQR